MRAAAGAWNFGLCATRSREPRQARKGATVPGIPRVPQITRSSSRREKLRSPKLGAVSKEWKAGGPTFDFVPGVSGEGRRPESGFGSFPVQTVSKEANIPSQAMLRWLSYFQRQNLELRNSQ